MAVFVLAIGAAPAAASVTLGQLASDTSSATGIGLTDYIQASVSTTASYVVPETGTITSWSHNARVGASQTLTMKVFRKVSDPNFYRVVGLDGPRNLQSGILNTFQSNVPVQAGDILGLDCLSGGVSTCLQTTGTTPSDTFLARSIVPNLNNGEAAAFSGPSAGARLNITAVLEPGNAITVGTTTLNKKKGTATLNLTLPNPGDLTASGAGVSASSAGSAVISKSAGAGAAQLLVKATGKKRKALNAKGKVTLNVGITFTPTNGSPDTQSVTVKLKKK